MTQDYYGTKRITAWSREKDGQPGYAVKHADGYVSWSPKDVFEAAYQPISAMSFGHALAAMKAGHRVRRAEWNPQSRGEYLFFVPGAEATDAAPPQLPRIYVQAPNGGPHILATIFQSDMLADDWMIVSD